MPVRVVKYDHNTQRATIKLTVTNAVTDGSGRKWWHNPTVQNVPVVFPGSTYGIDTYRITYPIGTISNGLYIVSTLPTDGWRSTDGDVDLDLGTGNTNHFSSGFLIPVDTKRSVPDAPVDAMVLHGPHIKIGGPTGTSPVALESTLTRFMQIIAPGHTDTTPGVPLTDPAGAIAILYNALRAANWPEFFVAVKTEAK
jgi:hypothetical protein